MHVISRKRLLDFAGTYPDARGQLLEWDRIIAHKRYANTAEVMADFPSVDFIGQGIAVFNIVGNKYRLVVEMNMRGRGLALIRHVVTHAEYDRLIARKRL
jgi:mRNA interferase HigB